MTADLLSQRVLSRLRERRNDSVMRLRLCKPRSPIVQGAGNGGASVAVIPPASVEEIALFAVDVNATVDALDNAIAIIQEEFKKITSPEQPDEDADSKPKGKDFYG